MKESRKVDLRHEHFYLLNQVVEQSNQVFIRQLNNTLKILIAILPNETLKAV